MGNEGIKTNDAQLKFSRPTYTTVDDERDLDSFMSITVPAAATCNTCRVIVEQAIRAEKCCANDRRSPN